MAHSDGAVGSLKKLKNMMGALAMFPKPRPPDAGQ
jgi:hypothetical protein